MRLSCLLLLAASMFCASARVAQAEAVEKTPAVQGDGHKVLAEQYIQPQAKHWHDYDAEWMKSFHQPADWISMGFDMRLRTVYAENMFNLNDANPRDIPRAYSRIRFRLSSKFALAEDIDLNSRLTWEFFVNSRPVMGNRSVNFDEAVFDHMNIQLRNFADLPLTMTFGRQDIMLGTGWLIAEGTPGDGSRTAFFDAVRGTYQVSPTTNLDLIYIKQYDDPAKWLRPLNHSHIRGAGNRWNTQGVNEEAAVVYLTDKSIENTTLEGYYIYKDADAVRGPVADSEIHTVGGRVGQKLDKNWSYSAELAGQWGNRGGASVSAMGSNAGLTYGFNDELSNQLRLGYEFMSGNNPASSRDGEFDPLWGQYPQPHRGGDLQSYIWTAESGYVGRVANLHMVGLGHSFKPWESWTLASNYALMWADENTVAGTTPATGPAYSDFGKFRGQAVTGVATYSCCKNFKAHLLLDYFIPGNYYQTRDNALFTRVNLEWTF